jgi:hypothetical protein
MRVPKIIEIAIDILQIDNIRMEFGEIEVEGNCQVKINKNK